MKKAPTNKARKKKAAKRKRRPVEDEEDWEELEDDGPERLIILPARGMLLFPRVVLPIVVGRAPSVLAIEAAVDRNESIGVLLQIDQALEEPGPEDLYEIGTAATILRSISLPDGTHHVIAQGESRFRILNFEQTEPYLVALVERIPEEEIDEEGRDSEARRLHVRTEAQQALSFLPQKPEDLDQAIENATTSAGLTDLVATFIDIPVEEKQEVLETFPIVERMELVTQKLAHVVEVLRLSHEIRQRTQGKMEKAQREYFLREQLRQIQQELGEGQSVEMRDLATAIDKAKLPKPVEREALRDLGRLERMPEGAAEYGMLRGYLETLVELPWSISTRDNLDIAHARAVLDEDHYGLEKIKRRILEFLAVRKLKRDGKGPILCFVGPPGVGKTSLGRSIARAMDRKFVRLSLGGVHDESEIRGHRRTYVGAMPGRIVQELRKVGSNNPVFMLDEIDKLGRSMHGDPSSALLEVLDPEQNDTFVDHYLNLPFDLSRVLFIATANVLDSIPSPLRDRCEVIHLSGYTEEEKLEIARRYLVARQTHENGLTEKNFQISDKALRLLIRSYTREAGVRNLEREIGSVARNVATRIAERKRRKVSVDTKDIADILGPTRFESELALRAGKSGVATGLAWTPVGGEVLFVEATRMPGKGQLILTGQLGDVMKESARAAWSLVHSNAERLKLSPELFENTDLHIHVPAGAIPKDGPSAGVAMVTAIVSLLRDEPVRADVAMTGEISLRGLVLPIGGIKEKVLAAMDAGITKVLLPSRNEKDYEEIPASARKSLEFVWIKNIDEALEHALGEGPKKKSKPAKKKAKAKRKTKR